MDIISMATLGLGGAGVIGVLTWILSKVFTKSKSTKLLDIFKSKDTVKKEQEKINKITKEQEIIVKQIEIAEMSSDATREKVKETIKKACDEIQVILKEDKIAAIDKQIEDDCEDI